MLHSYLTNPNGVTAAVIFQKVGNSLRPKTSEAVQLMTINSLQKRKGGFKSHKERMSKKAKIEESLFVASCTFHSTGTRKPDSRAQPTQAEKKMRRIMKQHFKR